MEDLHDELLLSSPVQDLLPSLPLPWRPVVPSLSPVPSSLLSHRVSTCASLSDSWAAVPGEPPGVAAAQWAVGIGVNPPSARTDYGGPTTSTRCDRRVRTRGGRCRNSPAVEHCRRRPAARITHSSPRSSRCVSPMTSVKLADDDGELFYVELPSRYLLPRANFGGCLTAAAVARADAELRAEMELAVPRAAAGAAQGFVRYSTVRGSSATARYTEQRTPHRTALAQHPLLERVVAERFHRCERAVHVAPLTAANVGQLCDRGRDSALRRTRQCVVATTSGVPAGEPGGAH